MTILVVILAILVVLLAGWLVGGYILPTRRLLKWFEENEGKTNLSELPANGGALILPLSRLIDRFLEKEHWYVSILDAIPFPLSVTDMNMNWTFINKPVEDFLKVKRENVLGHQCSEWNANICKTENCGIARLRRNFLQTFFTQQGGHFQVDSAYLHNRKGERVGHIEAVQSISHHVALSEYQKTALERLSGNLRQMANGDLTFKLAELPPSNQYTEEAKANFEHILADVDLARQKLSQALGIAGDLADQVSTASNQLASASNQSSSAISQITTTIQQISRGTSDSASSINRMAALLEEVSKAIQRVVEGARQQSESLRQAADVSLQISSEDGLTARVNQSAQTVREMGERSDKIGAIVETIEDIASQTNLLALNAAIEAARAGEHGKGFAVVADEVRKLAERSSASTKEIAQLVSSIQKSVAEAVNITTGTAAEMTGAAQQLDQSIKAATEIVSRNQLAAEQLTTNSNQVMQAVESIASSSQQNSAAIEEVSASSEEMTAQAEEVSASAQSLEQMAKELKEALVYFTVA